MTSQRVKVVLSVTTSGGAVFAKLVFNNQSSQVEFLDVLNAGLHSSVRMDTFIICRDGASVPFRGPRRKISLPDSQKYRPIRPGETVRVETQINQAYDMGRPGVYTIQYEAVHGSGIAGGVYTLTSNLVELKV